MGMTAAQLEVVMSERELNERAALHNIRVRAAEKQRAAQQRAARKPRRRI